MRVLGRVRLSRLTDESTSAARQRDIIEQWAGSNGHTVVGWAEDLDVSGSVDPFDAPALGPWLKRSGEWDILCAWKLDRIGRRAIPLNKLFGWMIDNHKTLVCVSDNIDLSTWVGRLVASVIAGVAEGELEAITERTRASRRKLLESGRWPGGMLPRGYRPVELESGGFRLEPDPGTAPEVRRIVGEVIAGKTVDEIAKSLGQHPSGVWKMLQSPNLLGHATYEGRTVRDRQGKPVCWGEPLISKETWEELRSALAERKVIGRRTRKVSPLHGVLSCAVCGQLMFHRRLHRDYGRGEYRYYFCRDKHGRSIPAEDVEQVVFDTFIDGHGDDPVLERVYRPAQSHQAALEDAVRAVDELTELLGGIRSATMRARLTEQLTALDAEIARLESLPSREAGWDYIDTGATFRQVWADSSPEQKRQMISDAEITASVTLNHNSLEMSLVTQKIPPPLETRSEGSLC